MLNANAGKQTKPRQLDTIIRIWKDHTGVNKIKYGLGLSLLLNNSARHS